MSAPVRISPVSPVTSAPQPIGTMYMTGRLLELFPTIWRVQFFKTDQSPRSATRLELQVLTADGVLQDVILRNLCTGYKKTDIRTQKRRLQRVTTTSLFGPVARRLATEFVHS
jgi:hypothetical protein